MTLLFWIGAFVLILSIASLFVPIPRNETEGFKTTVCPLESRSGTMKRSPRSLVP